jgi:hypothetical protein
MSRLKTSENLFLEVAELQRLVKFLEDDGYKRIIQSFIKSYGIVQNISNNNFKVTAKTGTSNVVVINSGLAFDSNLNAIVMESNIEMAINNTGITRWLILSRSVNNFEKGTVSINVDGSLTGNGTEFLNILRGQPNFPVKVKFNSSINTGEYEVVSVISDVSAIISGSFTSESSLQYSVIGTFTPGFQPLDENKQIYEYDSYLISIVDSESNPTITKDQFILASIKFDSAGIMSVSDERINYMFNNPYVQTTNSYDYSQNPLISLLTVSTVGGINSLDTISADFELIIEHGYSITKYELAVTSNTNIFNIVEGNCNFLGTGNITAGMFNGWLLLNRKNMKYAIIDNNVNKAIYISNLDTSIIEQNDNDFIVIPNFNEVEYEISVSSNVDNPSIPFYFKKSIWNKNSRLKIYAYMPSVSVNFTNIITVSVKYRMIDNSGKQYPFSNLSISQFTNIRGQTETLANSTFNINLADIEPQEKQRNYS